MTARATTRILAAIDHADDIELLEACIAHHRRAGADHFLVRADAATVREQPGLAALAQRCGAHVVARDDSDPDAVQAVARAVAGIEESLRPDWILFIGSDDFCVTDGGDLRAAVAGLGNTVVQMPRFNVLPVRGPDGVIHAPDVAHAADLPVVVLTRDLDLRDLGGAAAPWIMTAVPPAMMMRANTDGVPPGDSTFRGTESVWHRDIAVAHVPLTTFSRFERTFERVKHRARGAQRHDRALGAARQPRRDELLRDFERQCVDVQMFDRLRADGSVMSAREYVAEAARASHRRRVAEASRDGRTERRCFVHAGAPKTGTTAIQHFFQANAAELEREGFCVPLAGRSPERPGHPNVAMQLRGAPRFDPRFGTLDDVVAEIARSSAPRSVISAEDLALLYDRPAALSRLRDAIEAAGLSPAVLLYVRDHGDYTASIYFEAVKNGFIEPFERYLNGVLARGSIALGSWTFPLGFEPIARAFAGVFGRDAVVVRGYADRGNPDALIADVLDAVGMDAALAHRAAHAAQYDNARATTGDVVTALWRTTAARLRDPGLEAMGAELIAADPAAAGMPFDPLGEADRDQISARFAGDERALIECWGVCAQTFVRRACGTRPEARAARALFRRSEALRAAALDGPAAQQ